jgi:hypothetical protein
VHQLFIGFKKTYYAIRRGLVQYSDPVWYPHETAKDKKYVSMKPTAEFVLGKSFPHKFLARKDLQRGDALISLLFNFDIGYALRRVQVNQMGLKLNGTLQHLVCADDVNMLGKSVYTIQKNTQKLPVASEETGLKINDDKTNYIVMLEIRMQDEFTV